MKITREQYIRAVEQLPKLRKAEQIVAQWEQASKSHDGAMNGLVMVRIDIDETTGLVEKTFREAEPPSTT